MRDLAYMHLDALQGIIDKSAHFLSRLYSTTKAYQKKNGEVDELGFSAVIRFMRKNKIKQVEQTAVLGENKDLQVSKAYKIRAKLLIIALCWKIAWFTSKLLKLHYGKDMSFYQSFKTHMRDMYKLEKLFVAKLIPNVDYLIEFLKLSGTKHLLEKKKGQSCSPEVFCIFINI